MGLASLPLAAGSVSTEPATVVGQDGLLPSSGRPVGAARQRRPVLLVEADPFVAPESPAPDTARRRESQHVDLIRQCGVAHALSDTGFVRAVRPARCKQRGCLSCQRQGLRVAVNAGALDLLVQPGDRAYLLTFTPPERLTTDGEVRGFLRNLRRLFRAAVRDGRQYFRGGSVVLELGPGRGVPCAAAIDCRACWAFAPGACPVCFEGSGKLAVGHVHAHAVVVAAPFSYGYQSDDGREEAPGGGGFWTLCKRYGLGRPDAKSVKVAASAAAYAAKCFTSYGEKVAKENARTGTTPEVAALRQDAYFWASRTAWAFGAHYGAPRERVAAYCSDAELVAISAGGASQVAEEQAIADALEPRARVISGTASQLDGALGRLRERGSLVPKDPSTPLGLRAATPDERAPLAPDEAPASRYAHALLTAARVTHRQVHRVGEAVYVGGRLFGRLGALGLSDDASVWHGAHLYAAREAAAAFARRMVCYGVLDEDALKDLCALPGVCPEAVWTLARVRHVRWYPPRAVASSSNALVRAAADWAVRAVEALLAGELPCDGDTVTL